MYKGSQRATTYFMWESMTVRLVDSWRGLVSIKQKICYYLYILNPNQISCNVILPPILSVLCANNLRS